MEPIDNGTAEALLSSLQTIDPVERRKHASIFNYWLSIRGDRQFPPIRDLDPLEISDAGPWSVLLEMIGDGENAVIRHLGQAVKLGVDAESIARAPENSLLASIHANLPAIASSKQAMAFEDCFDAGQGPTRCWVTLLPFSTSGASIDYVYGFISLDTGDADSPASEQAELEPGQVPLAPLDEDPAFVESESDLSAEPLPVEIENDPETDDQSLALADSDDHIAIDQGEPESAVPEVPVSEAEPPLQIVDAEEEQAEADSEEPLELDAEFQPEAEYVAEPPAELPADAEAGDDAPSKAGFSTRFMESLANVGGFYGRVVHPVAPDDALVGDTAPNEPPLPEASAEASDLNAAEFEDSTAEAAVEPNCEAEGNLQSKLIEVRAMAEEARQAQLRSQLALIAGLSAAYDFALDAEGEPEEYLRLVEGQGLKIQLRAPMKPVVKLAFADTCDDSTIAQLEAVLAWALKLDLPRGTLAERIEAEGGIGSVLEGLGKAA